MTLSEGILGIIMIIDRIDIIKLDDITDGDRDLWTQFRSKDPIYQGPYFDFNYILACVGIVPYAFMARLYCQSKLVGFWAYQMRQKVMQPLGAPLCDYHGVVL
jgi:CelD/BcsL family acetyltransferase involved in cellulose biosynthesis